MRSVFLDTLYNSYVKTLDQTELFWTGTAAWKSMGWHLAETQTSRRRPDKI